MPDRRGTMAGLVLGLALGMAAAPSWADETAGPVLANVLRAGLETAADLEVIVSRVDLPPGTELPRHYHPGEEFGYVIEGTVTLWQQGREDIVLTAGEAVKIPLEQVHTARTGSEPARLLVFRIHRKGEPERIQVD